MGNQITAAFQIRILCAWVTTMHLFIWARPCTQFSIKTYATPRHVFIQYGKRTSPDCTFVLLVGYASYCLVVLSVVNIAYCFHLSTLQFVELSRDHKLFFGKNALIFTKVHLYVSKLRPDDSVLNFLFRNTSSNGTYSYIYMDNMHIDVQVPLCIWGS